MSQGTKAGSWTPRMIGYWHSADLPKDIAEILQSWHSHGPEEIAIYDRDSARAFIAEHYGSRELACFDACAITAMQSDLFRVLEVCKRGGFYLDLGIELLARPQMFLEAAPGLRLYRRWHGRIVNNMFAAPPGDPLLVRIRDGILSNIEQRISNDVWQVTGPMVWNNITDTGRLAQGMIVFEHVDLAGKVVRFRQDLAHKKDGNHWHEKQKIMSIFTPPT